MARDELPFIDAHEVILGLEPADAWRCLQTVVGRSTLLGSRGFPDRHETPLRCLRLAGAHILATYELCFELDDVSARIGSGAVASRLETRLVATTHARFTRGFGSLYRTLVISSGAHALIVRGFLRSVRHLARTGGA
jgi:hypothetical protein